jgi:hypothetical protein
VELRFSPNVCAIFCTSSDKTDAKRLFKNRLCPLPQYQQTVRDIPTSLALFGHLPLVTKDSVREASHATICRSKMLIFSWKKSQVSISEMYTPHPVAKKATHLVVTGAIFLFKWFLPCDSPCKQHTEFYPIKNYSLFKIFKGDLPQCKLILWVWFAHSIFTLIWETLWNIISFSLFSLSLSQLEEQTKIVNTLALHLESRAFCLVSACVPPSVSAPWNTKAPLATWGGGQQFPGLSLCLSQLSYAGRAADQPRVCQGSLTFRSRPQIINSFSKLTREPLFLRHTSSYCL